MELKKKRIKNPELLESIREKPCLFCGKSPSEAHHITTKGAGGGDTENNLMPVCRKHHAELHQIGYAKMGWKYPTIKTFLMKIGRYDVIEKMYGQKEL